MNGNTTKPLKRFEILGERLRKEHDMRKYPYYSVNKYIATHDENDPHYIRTYTFDTIEEATEEYDRTNVDGETIAVTLCETNRDSDKRIRLKDEDGEIDEVDW